MRTIVLSIACVVLIGCAPKRFSKFTGTQTWPVVPGAMADHAYAVPVYQGWPERPYRVVGSIRFSNPNTEWKNGDTAHAARKGKRSGGDAIIMRYGGEFGVEAITGAAADPKVVSSPHEVTVLVIKWRTEQELEAERRARQEFHDKFQTKYQETQVSSEAVALGADYIESLGLKLASDAGTRKLEEVLLQLSSSSKNEKGSKWLFRGTLKSSGLTSSFSSVVYGVASLSVTGENVTIVSEESTAEVNFSGSAKDGRLEGRLGVSSGPTIFSGKADGVLIAQKISLTGQGQTADGLVQGSFHFIR